MSKEIDSSLKVSVMGRTLRCIGTPVFGHKGFALTFFLTLAMINLC
jgi:hypothetical protein